MQRNLLIEAAKKGDVHTLHNLINDDPLVLRATMLFDGDSPLNVACLAGNLDFVKMFLSSNPELAAESNPDGFSPLHTASAGGNLEIVQELLKVGSHLCFVKGKYGRIPLHYAVCKGRKRVIGELLSCSLESIEEMTARGENCFHLAIMNSHFEVFKELVDFVVRHEKGEILKKKDSRGNNIFHVAAAYGSQYEVFDLLLDENFHYKEMIVEDINSLNKSGLTPLDVLLSNGICDREVEEMVRASGGKRVEEMQAILSHKNSMPAASQNSSLDQPEQQQVTISSHDRPRSTSDELHDYFKFKELNESPSKVRATLLVLAVLIATATYQAVLSPPGGVWQDDFWPIANSTVEQSPRHSAGQAVMGTKRPISYGYFLLFNSVGFFMSIQIIYWLTSGIPLEFELKASLFAVIATYDICMATIAPSGLISVLFVITSIFLPVILSILANMMRGRKRRRSNSSPSARGVA